MKHLIKPRRHRLTLCVVIATLMVCLGHSSLANAQETRRIENSPNNDTEKSNRLSTTTTENSDVESGLLKSSALNWKKTSTSNIPSAPTNGDDAWHFEVKPYVWLAAVDGTLRIGNQTAQVEAKPLDILSALDFAAALRVEAIKGRWRIIFDENYVNLGATGTGPLGVSNVRADPTQNILEFGASYTFASVPNNDATSTEPLPPAFTAEVLGGGRFYHFNIRLQPANTAAVEGSRSLIGAFVGNRFKGRPHKAVTLVGEYTVGFSGAGSNFAWSAEGLIDLRLRKQFSFFGGYRVLGINANQPSNNVGFDGQMRGLIVGATIYR